LQRLHQRRASQHGIGRLMRHGGMAAAPRDRDVKTVGAGHHRPVGNDELAGRQARPVVQAEDHVHREALE